jgi:hypothetical protein
VLDVPGGTTPTLSGRLSDLAAPSAEAAPVALREHAASTQINRSKETQRMIRMSGSGGMNQDANSRKMSGRIFQGQPITA